MTHDSAEAGIVFAATGAGYTTIARRAVRTLRQAMPSAAVDLFTDQPIDDPTFDRIHTLSSDWFRPKMEAMRRSRFGRTIYLDADILVIADISNLFDLLDRVDIAGSHGRFSNSSLSRTIHSEPLPPSFPQINSGVLVVRKAPEVIALLESWETMTRESGAKRDQPALREVLWHTQLRLHTIPRQYNFNGHGEIRGWDTRYAAPRVIHAPSLHRRPSDKPADHPLTLAEVMTLRQQAKLRVLVEADHSLRETPAPRLPKTWLSRFVWRGLAKLA